MNSRVVRIAVLSDLHFGSNEKSKAHTYVVAGADAVPRQHPVADLRALISSGSLCADVVVCPGDITLQADRVGLEKAWTTLNDITGDLGARHLLTTTGNHDIHSRLDNPVEESPEIWERLKQLSPAYPYPQGTRVQRLEYWSEHFFIAEIDSIRFVVLNSCNCHARGETEYERGRVTDYTIAQIQNAIGGIPPIGDQSPAILNVLLCHHHPVKQPEISQYDPDYSEMVQGRALLNALEESGLPWLVIHGHKHNPKIEYAQGASSGAPVIFSAGSFSAVLPQRSFPVGRNQFYIIEIDLDYVKSNGVAGVVHSWDWAIGRGWFASASNDSGQRIPTGAGFGHRAQQRDARDIDSFFSGRSKISWGEVSDQFEFVRYLTPEDLKRLLERLTRDHLLEPRWSLSKIFPDELLRRSS